MMQFIFVHDVLRKTKRMHEENFPEGSLKNERKAVMPAKSGAEAVKTMRVLSAS